MSCLLGERLEERRVLAAYVVDTAMDVVAEDGMVSLREAIQAANSNAAVNADTIAGEPTATAVDRITFAEGLSSITLSGELSITESIEIALGDAFSQIISGDDASRIFSIDTSGVDPIDVDLSGLTLQDGLAESGGAIYLGPGHSLSMTNMTLSDNVATGDAADEGGGALFIDGGTATITDSTITGNVADGASGSGGGILNQGTLVVSGGSISENIANRAGGGIEATGGTSTTLTNVLLDQNVAGPDGTAAPGNGGALHISGDGVVELVGGTVSGNVAAAEGGGLWNSVSGSLSLDGTEVSGNSAPIGGGIFNDSGVDVTTQTFTTTLSELNDSGVTGTANVTVDTSDPDNPSVTVSIQASGLVPNQPHIQHIHGRFASDLDSTGTIDGPFVGDGGSSIDSRTPDLGDDTNGDGFVTVGEGLAGYGNVLLNLSSPRAPIPIEGNSPLADFDLADFPTAPDGTIDFSETYVFDLSDSDQARQYNNLLPMSLREIVLHGVNTDIDVDGDGSPDGYRVTGPAAAGTLSAVGGTLTIANSTITGNTASGNGGGIANESGRVTITDSTISQNVSGGDEPGEGGGGIFNDGGTVTLTDTDVLENTAIVGLGNGGGILNNSGGFLVVRGGSISGNDAARAGGGVENAGEATFFEVEMDGNDSGINGGALHTSGPWTANFIDSVITNNTAGAEGGGVWNSGTGEMTLVGTTVTGNTASGDEADQGGGGVFNDGGVMLITTSTISDNVADGVSGSGGGVLNTGTLTVSDSTISGNVANRAGGGIEATAGTTTALTNVALNLNNVGISPAVAAPGNGGGLHITGDGDVTITGGTVNNNVAASEGGGLWNGSGVMTVTGTTIDGNVASGDDADNGGGGVFNVAGTVNITDSTVTGNVADGASGSGGGILNQGTLVVSGGSISENIANRAGGGIEATGGTSTTLTNVLLDQNVAGPDGTAAPGNGGALHISGDGVVELIGGTVSGNIAAAEGGGLWNSVSGSLSLDGTEVSGNSAPIGGGVFNDSGVDVTTQTFTTTLSELNDSGVTGTANVTVDTSDPDNPSVTVSIQASGLVPNQPHIQHIHGRFASDLDSTGTIDGPFIGDGGSSIDSRTPDLGDDTNGDGFVTVGEGLAGYGNVLLNLSSPRAPVPIEGNSPLADFDLADFPTAPDGTIDFSETYVFDLSDSDQARQYNNLLPMSLREIVLHGVNTDIDVDGDGSPDGYRVTGPAAAGTLSAVGGTLTIANSTITGNTASGNGGGIANESGRVTITDSTISQNVSGGDEPGEGGGGISNDGGTVTLTDTDVLENTAIVGLGNGGGILNNSGGFLVVRGGSISGNDAARAGGGVENAGEATFFEVEMDGNDTGINGGALHTSGPWTANFIDSVITNNTAGAEGGGVWNSSTGEMTLVGTTVTGNTASGDEADQGGGGVFNDGGVMLITTSTISDNVADGVSGSGGGVLNTGTLTVSDSTISGNVANRAGGGIEATAGTTTALTNVALNLNNVGISPAVAAPGNGGGLHITGDGDVTITGGTVNNNVTASEGGGLWNGSGVMTVTGTTIDGNFASGDDADNGGGGVFNVAGTVTITDSTITGNVADGASGSGGGILNQGTLVVSGGSISENVANRAGGGIEATGGTSTTLTNVLMDQNVAGPEGTAAPGNGGALHISGDGDATITGGTVSNNVAAREGGGLWNNTGVMTVSGTTLIGNIASGDAADDGGGGIFNNGGTLTVSDATLSGNAADGTLGSGGAIFSIDGDVTINSSQLGGPLVSDGNTANRAGGGIEVVEGSVTLNLGTDVSNNFAGINGGGLHSTGAAEVISNLSIFGSNVAASEGGGLWNSATGTMTINGGAISSNVASGDAADNGGGGLFNDGGVMNVADAVIGFNVADGASGSGGGILNDGGTLTVTGNTTISENRANRAGGGIEATGGSTSTLTGVSLDSNNVGISPAVAAPGNGGGLHITGDGDVTITGGTVNNNVAASEGGGLWNGSGVMTVTGTTIDGNVASGDDADNGGGGIFNVAGTLVVQDSIIQNNVADGAAGSGGGIFNAGTATITGTEITENTANRAGGGLEVIDGTTTTISASLLGDNVAGPDGSAAPGNGGALHISGGGEVTIVDTLVEGNTAASEGGGLWNSSTGTLVVERSTVSNNFSVDGGGVFQDGDAGNFELINSTIAMNAASNDGGGLLTEGGSVDLISVTIADNDAATGGGMKADSGTVSVINSIFSRNTATTDSDVSGAYQDDGNNLVGTEAGLGTLGDNGGPTPTIALLPGSPALDAGVLAGLSVDQRGVSRPQGTGVDIGAFESGLSAPVAASLSIAADNAAIAEGDSGNTSFTFTVTRSDNTAGAISANYSVIGSGENSADASDFGGSFPSGVVSFEGGQSVATITVNVSGDETVEPNESFTVTLDSASDGAVIEQASAVSTILNDDVNAVETRILIPEFVARPHLLVGDGVPTAIIFQALSSTTVTVTPVAQASVSESVRIVDADTVTISSYQNGVATADLEAGELYAVIFGSLSTDRIYSIRSSAGVDSLTNRAATNILQPTDTSADGETTALDALMVINELNRMSDAGGEPLLGSFVDVNRDENVTALDALLVINHLNRTQTVGNAEGEAIAPQASFVGNPDRGLTDDDVDQVFADQPTMGGGEDVDLVPVADTVSMPAQAAVVDEVMDDLGDDEALPLDLEVELLAGMTF
ncbi:dockerin type I domain-containing protein [Rhodopirellula sp. JC740]|uniref:Dockerin type I domain-containing protein n=1 Tax=Rhodopirellula halodulae TaxID=2894198 RepID=A0ABS8NEK4_9BACT|nr:choice-of-anchor Q domain-containing protein [Rhodopirellula sp. JC740]MCC9641989.1 dockerin type I domain-containing protein [Rhodopirellula sp. JC740]